MSKKMMKKKNNKGFSLVELIVVILIMAVLAVALAPQVMKWVENSRIAADNQNYDSLFSDAQLALTDPDVYKHVKEATSDMEITISSSGTTITDDDFKDGILAIDKNAESVKKQASAAGNYVIKVTKGTCEVVKTTTPGAVE